MKFFFLALSFTLLFAQHTLAQEATVSGQVLDTAQYQDMSGATVRLLRDTTVVAVVAADPGGDFRFRRVPFGDYSLSVSFQGYENWSQLLRVAGRSVRMRVYLRVAAGQLGEVVIRDNRPVVVHGDTTSYNADQFHTRPNGMVGDLLDKLPGVDHFEGPLMALGDTVKRILVNGKRFFGDNLQIALENLPRDIVARIEVFDDKSDQAKFTGVDDGIRVRTINIVTKRSANLGAVGQLSAGGGTDGNQLLYGASASVTHFEGESMTSIIGSSANTFPVLGGTSRNTFGGLNFSDHWGKRTQFSGSYNESNAASQSALTTYTENLLPGDSSIYNNQQRQNHSGSNNQAFNLNLEADPDSVNHLTIRGGGGLGTSSSSGFAAATSSLGQTLPLNQTNNTSGSNNRSSNASLTLQWGRRFHKQGRSLSLAFSGSTNNGNVTGTNQYTNTYFQPGQPDSVSSANQYYTGPTNGHSGSGSLAYTEPLGKHSSVSVSASLSGNRSYNGRFTYALDSLTHRYDQPDTLLTNLYTNSTSAAGGGFIYQYGSHRVQVSGGLNLTGNRLETFDESNGIDLKQRYLVVAPQLSAYYMPKTGASFRINYSGTTMPAPVNALHPLANNSDPLHVTIGNPELKQSFSQNLGFTYTTFDMKTMAHFISNVSISYTADPVGTRTLLDPRTGVDTTTYTNLGSSYSYRGNFAYGWRLHHPASNVSINMSLAGGHNEGYLNGILNASNTYTLGGGVQWSSNLPDHLDLNLWYGPLYNLARYSAEPGQNTHYLTQNVHVNGLWYEGNWQIGSIVSFTGYSGRPAGFNTDILIWDASVSRLFFKRQTGELKLAAHDLLNQSASVNESFTPTTIQNVQGRMLGRYYLLSFIYHLKG